MKFVEVWSLQRGRLDQTLSETESVKANEQLEREGRFVTEHGVRIPAWSDEAKVIWDPRYMQRMIAISSERRSRVGKMVGLAKKARVA